jgi:dTDP-glucose pyrophosphorylase
MEKVCPCKYVFQELDDLPEGFALPEGRTKPWGTGQALLACRGVVNNPFIVINADDYYGKEGFRLAHDFLVENAGNAGKFCMPGFILKNTLSENGGVTRGVCTVKDGYLAGVVETGGLVHDGEGAAVEEDGKKTPIDPKSIVSMNMWALTPDFFDELESGFVEFLSALKPEDIKAEYLLPKVIDTMIQTGKATVKVLTTNDRWFGVTYQEDKWAVIDSFKALHEAGVYTEPLYK